MSVIKQNLLKLHNQHRSGHGRRALAINSTLNQGAQYLADQMSRGQWQSSDFGSNHKRPNGQSFGAWWDKVYRNTHAYYGWGAENLGWGWTTSSAVFGPMGSHGGNGNTWTTSTPHHGFLIDSRARKVGFGVATDSRGRYYWVAHFAD